MIPDTIKKVFPLAVTQWSKNHRKLSSSWDWNWGFWGLDQIIFVKNFCWPMIWGKSTVQALSKTRKSFFKIICLCWWNRYFGIFNMANFCNFRKLYPVNITIFKRLTNSCHHYMVTLFLMSAVSYWENLSLMIMQQKVYSKKRWIALRLYLLFIARFIFTWLENVGKKYKTFHFSSKRKKEYCLLEATVTLFSALSRQSHNFADIHKFYMIFWLFARVLYCSS